MSFAHIFRVLVEKRLGKELYDENSINQYTLKYNPRNVLDVSKLLGYPDKNVYHYDTPVSHIQQLSTWLFCRLPKHTDDRSLGWEFDLEKEIDGYGFKLKTMGRFSAKLAELTRMEQLQYMVTNGVGLPLKRPGKFGFCIDLSLMEQAEVRKGYMRYGGFMVFDSIGNIQSITYQGNVYLRADIPQAVYAICIASIVAYVTIVLHAGLCHLSYSGHITVMLRRYMDIKKNISEPGTMLSLEPGTMLSLEELIQVFCFRNSEINTSARDILISNGGIIERLFAFTTAGMKHVLSLSHAEDKSFDKWIFETTTSCSPRLSSIERIIGQFIEITLRFLDTTELDTEIKGMLLKQITVSTVIHELVGSTIGIYFLHPDVLKTKIPLAEASEDFLKESQTSYGLNKLIVYLTSGISVPMLLGDNIRFCFTDEKLRQSFVTYQTELRSLHSMSKSVGINDGWSWNSSYFDIRNMETSISL
jgi:hypothetical protein